jgi:hypothetical protein
MSALIRLAVVVALALPLALFCLFGFRFACNPVGMFLQEVHRGEALDQLRQTVFPLVLSKEQVVREVIAQQCGLKEAVARLQELDCELERKQPDFSATLSEIRARKRPSDVERHYQYITTMVKDLLRDRPEEAAAVLRRLEKDYQQLQTNTQTPSTAPMERTERHR